MKICGFMGGQFGDAIIAQGAVSSIRKLYPDCNFTFALSKKYGGILPLFENQPNIQRTHIWEGYDREWPTEKDTDFLKQEKFDILFHPMAYHKDNLWYLNHHQVTECCNMYNLPAPETNEITLVPSLTPCEVFKNYVGLSLFPNNGKGIKSLSLDKAEIITEFINKKNNCDTVQLAGPDDPFIRSSGHYYKAPYMECVRALLACKLLITGDTGMCWIASALKIPVVGLFATAYYPYAQTSINWQPVNPKAIYLEGRTVDDIPMSSILSVIEQKL